MVIKFETVKEKELQKKISEASVCEKLALLKELVRFRKFTVTEKLKIAFREPLVINHHII